MNWKLIVSAVVVGCGAALIVHGVSDIYEPAGFIVSGLAVIALAVLPDWGA
jgi:hypothetical protein